MKRDSRSRGSVGAAVLVLALTGAAISNIAPAAAGTEAAAPTSAASAPLVTAKHDLQNAVNAGEYAPIAAVRARLAALSAADSRSALLHYWVAVADWRAATALMRPGYENKKKTQQHLKAGIAEAERAAELDPALAAEAISVKLGLQGLSIAVGGMFAGMTIGPKMEAEISKALSLAPDNPRVRFAEGMNTLHKPAFVGGSAEKALATFRKSIQSFDAERPADPTAPDWGHDDAYLWAGRTAMKLEDYETARTYFAKTLEINPNHGWARYVLLPEAEKAIAKRQPAKSGT
jgi:tetratricopeptide (TPR) repeat protein